MSLALRSHTAASREDAKENQRPKMSLRAVNSKRPVLGNVTNQVRRQPQRIAKDKHLVLQVSSKSNFGGQENEPSGVLGKKIGSMAFAIFEDGTRSANPAPIEVSQIQVDVPMHDQENLIPEHSLELHEAVVGLNRLGQAPRPHIPLASLSLTGNSSNVGSPMVVDESLKEHEAPLARHDEFGLDTYFEDIYSYLRATEMIYRPNRDYMEKQTDVTSSMRNILVDWLVEVAEEYKLQRETLFLSVSYIDSFLSKVGVHRPKLQLVGAASMFIASKYEEIYPPDVAEFVYITDDTYTRGQVLKMESVILKLLEFRVSIPTINWFAERFIDVAHITDKAKFLTHFLTELSLIEVEELLPFRPSVIAASAIVLAQSTLNQQQPWSADLEKMSGYTLVDLRPCVKVLFGLYSRVARMPQQAVIEKYKQEKFGRVSLIEPPHFLAIY